MRLLGIDFGSKRVGIALTDESGTMAFPRDVFENNKDLVKRTAELAEAENVERIIIGHSLRGDGTENPIQEAIREFIGELTLLLPVSIELVPEQYTTKEALRLQEKNEYTDASAAAIILNSYIERTKNEHDQL